MATTSTTPEIAAAAPDSAPASVLIHLASLSHPSLDLTLANLAAAFPSESLFIATPDSSAAQQHSDNITLLNYTPAATPSANGWLLSAADFLNTWKLASDHGASSVILLGPESQSLSVEPLRALAAALHGRDLALPRYRLGPRDGLVNSAILYPLTRALFSARSRFPLAVDLGLSARMAERLAATAQRFTSANQNEALLWPVAEATVANYTIAEVPAGPRILPAPTTFDLNTILAQVAGSLFTDIEAKASFWQRARVLQRFTNNESDEPGSAQVDLPEDIGATIASMLDSFRLAYTNLHEIWALVLPPNSLLGLKKLSQLPPESFRMPDALWVRIVYDFLLAYRLRTLNRTHLLGALTPLYLAWAASHLQLTAGGVAPEQHIEQQAAAFESDKPYLVSRWRWPDRFNP